MGVLALAAPAAFAEEISQPQAVVELFTSQGCSSCPSANAALVRLDAEQPDVLALTYGVTYWDYLGWEDTFGDPAFTDRQRAYDSALESGVYTPMMVVAGRDHMSRMGASWTAPSPVPATVTLHRESGELCVSADLPEGATLALVNYSPGVHSVAVKRGENKGRKLTLANVVTGIGYRTWTGETLCGLRAGKGLAVLAHDTKTAEVIGAARLEP